MSAFVINFPTRVSPAPRPEHLERGNLFTGWYDADLTDQGRAEAVGAVSSWPRPASLPDVLHTSLQSRAIRTANLALDEMGRLWIPVRRPWRLNERHYGDLQGKDKKQTAEEYGADQVKIWRRSYDVPPPPLRLDDERHPRFDPRYADLAPDVLPALGVPEGRGRSGCCPTGTTTSSPTSGRPGRTVLVVAHGNSLRALVKHLDGISDADIAELNLPTGVPMRLRARRRPAARSGDHALEERYLGDVEAAKAAAEAVAKQAG